jgi:hypothetical protein
MTDFYSRDRSKAFDELKEDLYAWLRDIEVTLDQGGKQWQYYLALLETKSVVEGLLDKIERS